MDDIARLTKALLIAERKASAANVMRDGCIEDRHWYESQYDETGYQSVLVKVPVNEYVLLKESGHIRTIEQDILSAYQDASSGNPALYYSEVKIVPDLNVAIDTLNDNDSIDEENFNGWNPGWFRLFISHVSEHKVSAVNLKKALVKYRISGFVAHEDVTPAAEWIQEIDAALRSMDGLCAIMSPQFAKSDWCDQEVGYGLGRKVICIPIKKDIDPYGFLGRYQAVSSNSKNAHDLAHDLFEIISTNKISRQIYQRKLANILLNARHSAEALEIWALFGMIINPDADVLEYIRAHMKDNKSLMTQASLKEANTLFEKHNLEPVKPTPPAPIQSMLDDDGLDLPF